MRSTDGDFVTLYGKSFEDLETCSATTWLATMTIGGTMGRLSTNIIGGLPNTLCISAKMASIFAFYLPVLANSLA